MAAPKQTDPQFKLRMTPEIKERIERAATENNRSMNAEILARLDESFLDVVRLPDDLRLRIQASANTNQRSVNGEAIQVLTQYFPPEPSLYELLDNIDMFLRWSRYPSAPPYKRQLVDAIKELGWRLERGIEFDPTLPEVLSPDEAEKKAAWKRQAAIRRDWTVKTENSGSVTTDDFKTALDKGFLNHTGFDRIEAASEAMDEGKFERSLAILGLSKIKFAEPDRIREVLAAKLQELTDGAEF